MPNVRDNASKVAKIRGFWMGETVVIVLMANAFCHHIKENPNVFFVQLSIFPILHA